MNYCVVNQDERRIVARPRTAAEAQSEAHRLNASRGFGRNWRALSEPAAIARGYSDAGSVGSINYADRPLRSIPPHDCRAFAVPLLRGGGAIRCGMCAKPTTMGEKS